MKRIDAFTSVERHRRWRAAEFRVAADTIGGLIDATSASARLLLPHRRVTFVLADALQCNSILKTKRAHLADHACALGDESIPPPVQRLEVDLIGGVRLDKTQPRTS